MTSTMNTMMMLTMMVTTTMMAMMITRIMMMDPYVAILAQVLLGIETPLRVSPFCSALVSPRAGSLHHSASLSQSQPAPRQRATGSGPFYAASHKGLPQWPTCGNAQGLHPRPCNAAQRRRRVASEVPQHLVPLARLGRHVLH